MKILGIGPSMIHDPSAVLLIDGRVVAAAEEERFIREKHAANKIPAQAVRYCLKQAGILPEDIDVVAFGWSEKAFHRHKAGYLRRKFFDSPNRALKVILRSGRICADKKNIAGLLCRETGIPDFEGKVRFVEHHLAHAASTYYFSGFDRAAVFTCDGSGEFTATMLAKAEGGKIFPVKEICVPDSLGLFYSTFTEYLGFRSNNGEYKVMGMAPYGDASGICLDDVVRWDGRNNVYTCDDRYVWVKRGARFVPEKHYSRLCARRFGPPREGDGLSEPHVHIAAAVQKKLEDTVIRLIEHYLKDDLLRHGNLCVAGGVALNVALNRVLLKQPYIKRLWVQPASHDAGTALGAAAYIARENGEKIEPMKDAYLGPEYTAEDIRAELEASPFAWRREKDICGAAADLLSRGKIVGWFQGRMEWGPRALGNRSILGNPAIPGTADEINARIKFREKWRPFCPSILEEHGQDILASDHPAPFMAIAFDVSPAWKDRIPEAVHVNGTCRPQLVDRKTNPRYYRLIDNFYERTGVPVLINTSLNRRGEPMVCSPHDALLMFEGSGLEYLAIGDFLVTKE